MNALEASFDPESSIIVVKAKPNLAVNGLNDAPNGILTSKDGKLMLGSYPNDTRKSLFLFMGLGVGYKLDGWTRTRTEYDPDLQELYTQEGYFAGDEYQCVDRGSKSHRMQLTFKSEALLAHGQIKLAFFTPQQREDGWLDLFVRDYRTSVQDIFEGRVA